MSATSITPFLTALLLLAAFPSAAQSVDAVPQADRPLGLLRKRVSTPPENVSPAPQASSSSAKETASSNAKPALSPKVTPPPSADVTDASKSRPAPAKPSAKPATPKSVRDSNEPDNMTADIAALENLRPGTRAASAATRSGATSEVEKSSESERSSSEAAEQNDQAAVSETESVEVATLGVEPATAHAETVAPPPAPVLASSPPPAAPVPNLYLSQPTPRSGGFLSRLFNRGNNSRPGNAATAPVPAINFTSDYATRDRAAILPAVLPGNGINGVDLPIGAEDQYRLTSSLPTDFRPTDLVLLPKDYCHFANSLYLRREAAGALCQMINAAAQEGLCIRVVSAFRDYSHQQRLYNQAVARGGPDQKSVARPGRSEHFLGTTVDLTNNNTHLLKRSFGDTPEGRWLAANAARYGWKMTVMAGNGRRSHDDEPWHLRYLGSSINNSSGISPIAQQSAPAQRRDIFGSIGRRLGLRR